MKGSTVDEDMIGDSDDSMKTKTIVSHARTDTPRDLKETGIYNFEEY